MKDPPNISLLGKVQPRWNVVVTVSEGIASERVQVDFGELKGVMNGLVRILMSGFTVEPSTLPVADQQQKCENN